MRGGASLGRAIGNFFGVTDQSQFGTVEQAGWAQVGPASAEETFSIGRRLSFRTGLAEEPPPEYPGVVVTYVYMGQQQDIESP